ncbi:hypothetical protein B0T25DRAFT_492668 [Lasiosphaeria hispida]|uniref:Uncharacterized protein n=1 Tax=Lasiosphaeria hispida TaxID=260671 RepID=A0AAJ0HVJ2_9PEZI|nr:hypothetical protein B0T25DRAFT_492668 [Lasiosphaeria hispida]
MELPTGTRVYPGIWTVAFRAIYHAFFVAVASGSCAPYPVSVRIGNDTLRNDGNARGVAMSVGTPEQDMAFVPQWNLNNTMLYGSSAFCYALSDGNAPWSAKSCITMRGGQYDPFNSKTRTGVGTNSTFMSALVNLGKIATRAWSIFWGCQGATRNTQLDGSMVFGGYDRAKVTGIPLTQQLAPQQWDGDNMKCLTGMTVYISDLILNFGNNIDVSLFSNDIIDSEFPYQELAHKFPAYMIPNAPYLIMLPLYPYFKNFHHYISIFINKCSLSINFYMIYCSLNNTPYSKDLAINTKPLLSIRIPNDQLVMPEKHIDSKTG